MNDHEKTNAQVPHDDNDPLATLLKLSGARPQVSAERMARARKAVYTHWQTSTAVSRPSFWRRPAFAMAAGLMLALLVAWQFGPGFRPTAIPDAAAQFTRVTGEVNVAGQQADTNRELVFGQAITTGQSGLVAIRLPAGQSLRLGPNSHALVTSGDEVRLLGGMAYIDSNPAINAGPVRIWTPLGEARDIGTQFLVQLSTTQLIIGVREGQVALEVAAQPELDVFAGEFLTLADNGRTERQAVNAQDPRWDWTEEIAPEFELEGATLAEFLSWFARERGLKLEWQSDESADKAADTLLTGSLSGVALDEALTSVQLIAPFEYQLQSDAITVSVP